LFFRRKARPSEPAPQVSAQNPAPAHRFGCVLVACARWEEADILEWVEYHRILGVDHIFLYGNDDDPAVLRKLMTPYTTGAAPFVTYLHWPALGQQTQIYLHFLNSFADQAEWACFLDIDEFIVLRMDETVPRFLARYTQQADCIYLHWLIYGTDGRAVRDASLDVLPSYTRHSAALNFHPKNFFRPSCVRAEELLPIFQAGAPPFWHVWDCYKQDMRIVDVLGGSVDGFASNFPDSAVRMVERPGYESGCREVAYVAHFQFKSEEDFARRQRRGGFANDEDLHTAFREGTLHRQLDEANTVYDDTLARFWHQRMFAAQSTRNLALFKPTEQSSVYQPTTPEPPRAHVRDHGNDGVLRGTYGFHTAHEDQPWWWVDLLDVQKIGMIRIYNRVDSPLVLSRAAGLIIETSLDGDDWHVAHRLDERALFGGLGSEPLVLRPELLEARFVRLSLPGTGYLHLDEVEVLQAE
jgi:hypothetical protein